MAETRANPADSYIGSLISLTSKSEIRYEGLLYTVDTDNSNIALQNVRSFGTEGRKMNGPQIPASDKVYEFIIFRGTDIKDLQVKMSPPPPSIHNDPAIISLQQAAQPSQPISAPPPPPYGSPVADLLGNASSTYKANSVPYYVAGNSNVPLWAPPPPPPGPSRSMPAYWQGYYRPQEEHRLLQPFVAPAPPPAPLLAQATAAVAAAAPSVASTSAPTPGPAPATQGPQTLATSGEDPPGANASQSSSNQTPTHTPLLPALTQLGSSSMPEVGFSIPLAGSSSLPPSSSTSEPRPHAHGSTDSNLQPSKSDYTRAQPLREVRSVGPSGASSGARSSSVPSPATQASRKSGSASGKVPMVYKQVSKQGQGVKEPLKLGHRVNLAPAAQPLLPLPVSPIQHKALFQMADRASRFNTMRRGRGRGGISRASRGGHSRSKVLDDFDFIAMNEKFKKEEVWGELLKVGSKERTGDGDGSDVDYEARETGKDLDQSLLEISRKSVYVKDDFFDSLSCDALDKGQGRSERPKFSEQRKIDAETFGTFQVRTYRNGGRGSHRGKRGTGDGGRGGGQGRGVRGRGHGFGFFNGNRGGDGRAGHVG